MSNPMEPAPYWRAAVAAIEQECAAFISPDGLQVLAELKQRADDQIIGSDQARLRWITERAVRAYSRHHNVSEEVAAADLISTAEIPARYIPQLPKSGWTSGPSAPAGRCDHCHDGKPRVLLSNPNWPQALRACLPCATYLLSGNEDGPPILLSVNKWNAPPKPGHQPSLEFLIRQTYYRLHLTKADDGWFAVVKRIEPSGQTSLGTNGPHASLDVAKAAALDWLCDIAGVTELPDPSQFPDH